MNRMGRSLRQSGVYACALFLMSLFMTVCISDDSEYGSDSNVPTLKVTGDDTTEMLVYNFHLGETVQITPDVNYSGDASNLVYNWQVGTLSNGVKGTLSEAATPLHSVIPSSVAVPITPILPSQTERWDGPWTTRST